MEVLFFNLSLVVVTTSSNLIWTSHLVSVLAGFVQMNAALTLRRSQNIDNINACSNQAESATPSTSYKLSTLCVTACHYIMRRGRAQSRVDLIAECRTMTVQRRNSALERSRARASPEL